MQVAQPSVAHVPEGLTEIRRARRARYASLPVRTLRAAFDELVGRRANPLPVLALGAVLGLALRHLAAFSPVQSLTATALTLLALVAVDGVRGLIVRAAATLLHRIYPLLDRDVIAALPLRRIWTLRAGHGRGEAASTLAPDAALIVHDCGLDITLRFARCGASMTDLSDLRHLLMRGLRFDARRWWYPTLRLVEHGVEVPVITRMHQIAHIDPTDLIHLFEQTPSLTSSDLTQWVESGVVAVHAGSSPVERVAAERLADELNQRYAIAGERAPLYALLGFSKNETRFAERANLYTRESLLALGALTPVAA